MPYDPATSPALALTGLPDVSAATLRRVIDRCASMGVRALALSCNAPGLRPRELGRTARRDVIASLKRADLACAGVDLFVPPKHLADPRHSARAVEAYREAIAFASDIAELTGTRKVLTTTLPRGEASVLAIEDLAGHADRLGVTIADLAWPPMDDAPASVAPALDPAVALRSVDDVASLAAKHAKSLAGARLSDADDAARVPVGDGRLDAFSYLLSLHAGGYDGPVVIDVRGLKDPWGAVERAIEAIEDVPPPLPTG